jgi:hypothetical protein
MTRVLARQGFELSGWPEGVPTPESHGKSCKGISGLDSEHIGMLYVAMKARQIDIQPLAGGSQTRDASRVRQREDDVEDEVDIRPSKKGKPAETRKTSKAYLDMMGVMKFET